MINYLEVDLRHDNISAVDFNLDGFEKSIKSEEFEGFLFEPVKIHLEGNECNCSCKNYDLLRYVQGNFSKILYSWVVLCYEYHRCASFWSNILLYDVDIPSSKCEDSNKS